MTQNVSREIVFVLSVIIGPILVGGLGPRGPLFHANYFALSLSTITIIFAFRGGDLLTVGLRVNAGQASQTLGQH